MKFDLKKFAEVVKLVAPTVLIAVNPALAPVASVVAHAITEAESIPGASGPEKLQHVQDIVATVAPNIPGVNSTAVTEALQEGVDTVIAVTKIVEKKAA